MEDFVTRAYDLDMERLSISVPDELASSIRAAANDEGSTLSAWIAHAAETQLKLAGARRLIAEWETEHGVITPEEVHRARHAWRE